MLQKIIILLCLFVSGTHQSCWGRQDPNQVQSSVEHYILSQTRAYPGQVSITITPPSSTNTLTPCSALEVFTPPNTRLWGRVMVGVRCPSGGNWSLYVRAYVRVDGTFIGASHGIRAGQTIQAEDLSLEQGELTQLPSSVITQAEHAIGRIAAINIAPGQALRNDILKQPPLVHRNQQITVVARGEGFQVASEGIALSDAAAGQVVQVRLSNGQIRTGIAQADGLVELRF